MRKALIGCLQLMVLAFGLSSIAQAKDPSGFYISPGVGVMSFDHGRDQESRHTQNYAVGYQYKGPFAVELNYLNGHTEHDDSGVDISYDHWSIGGRYSLNKRNQLTPYLALGVGEESQAFSGSKHRALSLNYGGGLKYTMTDQLAFRADVRAYHKPGLDDGHDVGLTLAFDYLLGGVKNKGPSKQASVSKSDNHSSASSHSSSVLPVNNENQNSQIVLDNDNDGVIDRLDHCLNTLSGAKVNKQGCDSVFQKSAAIKLRLEFDHDSAQIRPADQSRIAKFGQYLLKYPNAVALIVGHTDSSGQEAYNQALSESRANNLGRILIEQHGVNSNSVKVMGYGEDRPLAENTSPDGRQKNRRVTAIVNSRTTQSNSKK